MAKKIKLITCLIIALILAVSISALVVVNGRQIDMVKKVTMTANTANSVSIEWSAVKKAEGYRVYIKDNDSGEFKLYKELTNAAERVCEITQLGSVSTYDVKVTAFKHFLNEMYESEDASPIKLYTLPDKTEQSASSDEEGQLAICWKVQKNVSGYEVEYSKDKAFSDYKDEKISDASTDKFNLEGLKPKDIYYTRVRAYADIDSNKVYGDWSDIAEVMIKEKIIMKDDIDPKKPIVALSFDDGPAFYDNGTNSTDQILDVLEEYGARATFFMCASRINKSNADCLKREIELGCEIGNHTYDHKNYGKNVTADDIRKASDRIKEYCGKPPSIFRCPGGIMSAEIQKECKKEGMPIAYWSVDTEDWKSKNPDKIYDMTMNSVYDGSIILMHDIYPTTAQAVKKIVPKLIEEGYQIVTVSEMLAVKNGGKAPKAGEQYIDYKTMNNNTK